MILPFFAANVSRTLDPRDLHASSILSEPALVAYWPLDEGAAASQTYDWKGQRLCTINNSGTGAQFGKSDALGGLPPLRGGADFTSSSSGYASFNGDLTPFDRERTDPFSIECILVPNITRSGVTAEYCILSKQLHAFPNQGYGLYLRWDGIGSTNLLFRLNSATNNNALVVRGTTDLQNGQAYHVLVSYNGNRIASGMQMYLDGRDETMAQITAALTLTTLSNAPISIGSMQGLSRYMNGRLDEVAFYNAVLPRDSAVTRAGFARGRIPPADPVGPVNLVVVTDMYADCDDAAAVAIAARLHQLGECSLKAVVTDTPVNYAAGATRAILDAYGLTSIPVGAYQGSVGPGGTAPDDPHWTKTLATQFKGGISRISFDNDVNVLRTTLVNTSSKVVVCAVGLQTVIDRLLQSPADGISALNGIDLVKAKVARLVVMGGGFATGPGGSNYNFQQNPAAASAAFANWPAEVPVIIHGEDIGGDVPCGPPVASSIVTSPVKRAFSSNPALLDANGKRSSWDPLAVLYAVRGNSANWYKFVGMGGENVVNPTTGVNQYYSTDFKNHWFLRKTVTPAVMGTELDNLLATLL